MTRRIGLPYTIAIASLMLGGCISLGRGRTLSSQVVVAKTADGYLVAAGGDKCRATSSRLAAASIGSSVRCLWIAPDRRESRLGAPILPRPRRP
jgi:hypothetical protein